MARLSDEDREDLVAYLDGELDEAAARQLEAKLSIDAEARAEAEALQQTWGLLDYLPRPEPSPSFTHRTLERLAVHSTMVARRRWPRWVLGLGWAAAVLLALAAGLGGARLVWPARTAETTEFLRALDHPDLFGEDSEPPADEPAQQTRLKAVASRYSQWLDALDTEKRDKISSAADKDARLQLIKQLRENEWLERQPKKIREELAKLDGEPHGQRLQEVRAEERKRRQEWQIAVRFWGDVLADKLMPTGLADLHPDDQVFVKEYLRPRLSPEEKARLDEAEGHWPLFPKTLVELADRHPMALYNLDHGPDQFRKLPKEVQAILLAPVKKGGKFVKKVIPKEIEQVQDRWPLFAFAVARYAKNNRLSFPNEFWPNDEQGLSQEVKDFLNKTLRPRLTGADRDALNEALLHGWPDYPRVLNELARKHHLRVPWQTLPGPRHIWDKYRLKSTS